MSDPEHECPTEGHGGECAGPLAGNGHLPCPTCCDATRSARTDEFDIWNRVVAPDRNPEQNQPQASAKAIREEFDLFGITVVGLAMAFAGGTTRDLLVNRVPLALQSPIEISLGLLGVGLAVALSVMLDSPDNHPIVVLSDAIGLAAFATTGAIVAADTGVSAFGVVAVATINAVGGGAFADILLDRPRLFSSRTSMRVAQCSAAALTGSWSRLAGPEVPPRRCVQR